MEKRIGNTLISLEKGDITAHAADAVVNAANSSLLGGGGVDGAIHRVGGPEILEECKQIRNTRGRCDPGDAVITTAGKLPARFVIHTVGPIWQGGHEAEADTLASCYRRCLELAVENEVKSIAFPSISTGAYGYPIQDAALIAFGATREFLTGSPDRIERVTWVLFDEGTFGAYEAAIFST